MLNHGGGVFAASRHYGIPLAEWLDLSTGLNPQGWPVPDVPARSWQRLPEMADGLEEAAANYYGSPLLLSVAGSQPAIQGIPQLRPPSTVALLETTYAEHPHAWETYGHQVRRLPASALDAAADHADVMVVCNPNNPTGLMFAPELLESWRRRLTVRGGWLVIDEAFIDATPEQSMMPLAGQPGLIILRSIGKFFGLAGARVGFVFAWPTLLDQLGDTLGPWTVSGPGRFAAKGALLDSCWQQQTRLRLARDAARLADCLAQFGVLPTGSTRLFQWWQSERARSLHEALARAAILTRYFDAPCSIRFGLPATENDWLRLGESLDAWAKQA